MTTKCARCNWRSLTSKGWSGCPLQELYETYFDRCNAFLIAAPVHELRSDQPFDLDCFQYAPFICWKTWVPYHRYTRTTFWERWQQLYWTRSFVVNSEVRSDGAQSLLNLDFEIGRFHKVGNLFLERRSEAVEGVCVCHKNLPFALYLLRSISPWPVLIQHVFKNKIILLVLL